MNIRLTLEFAFSPSSFSSKVSLVTMPNTSFFHECVEFEFLYLIMIVRMRPYRDFIDTPSLV